MKICRKREEEIHSSVSSRSDDTRSINYSNQIEILDKDLSEKKHEILKLGVIIVEKTDQILLLEDENEILTHANDTLIEEKESALNQLTLA